MIDSNSLGWAEYHETHDPTELPSGGGVLWIPKEPGAGPAAISLADQTPETEDELVAALIEAMAFPLTDYYACGCPVEHADYRETSDEESETTD